MTELEFFLKKLMAPTPEIAPAESDWPPPYTIRHSTRAKYLSLQITPRQGLEVIVPKRYYHQPSIGSFLEEKRSWIEKNLTSCFATSLMASLNTLPDHLELRAIDKKIQIHYIEHPSNLVKIKADSVRPDTLIIKGKIHDPVLVFKNLRKWLKIMAGIHLVPWLDRLSLLTGFSYSKVLIRQQSTLWGSCTFQRRISLNCKLLFLPPNLVNYVLLHELCHTRYLNHSKRFWALLQKFDPQCLFHRKLLRKSNFLVPGWLDNPV